MKPRSYLDFYHRDDYDLTNNRNFWQAMDAAGYLQYLQWADETRGQFEHLNLVIGGQVFRVNPRTLTGYHQIQGRRQTYQSIPTWNITGLLQLIRETLEDNPRLIEDEPKLIEEDTE